MITTLKSHAIEEIFVITKSQVRQDRELQHHLAVRHRLCQPRNRDLNFPVVTQQWHRHRRLHQTYRQMHHHSTQSQQTLRAERQNIQHTKIKHGKNRRNKQ